MKLEYHVVVGRDPRQLADWITDKLNDPTQPGWKFCGGVNVSHNVGATHNHTYYAQALTREVE